MSPNNQIAQQKCNRDLSVLRQLLSAMESEAQQGNPRAQVLQQRINGYLSAKQKESDGIDGDKEAEKINLGDRVDEITGLELATELDDVVGRTAKNGKFVQKCLGLASRIWMPTTSTGLAMAEFGETSL